MSAQWIFGKHNLDVIYVVELTLFFLFYRFFCFFKEIKKILIVDLNNGIGKYKPILKMVT